MRYLFEACVDSFCQARAAQELGADRIELCSNLDQAGLTPSKELIQQSKELKIPVNVIIRLENSFTASSEELEEMLAQIEVVSKCECNGVVFGLLKDSEIDIEGCEYLIERCDSRLMKVFHMAFDELDPKDYEKNLEVLKGLGFDGVLTKGGREKAINNIEQLKRIIEYADTIGLQVIVGGGVTVENYGSIAQQCNCKWLHGKRIVGDLA